MFSARELGASRLNESVGGVFSGWTGTLAGGWAKNRERTDLSQLEAPSEDVVDRSCDDNTPLFSFGNGKASDCRPLTQIMVVCDEDVVSGEIRKPRLKPA